MKAEPKKRESTSLRASDAFAFLSYNAFVAILAMTIGIFGCASHRNDSDTESAHRVDVTVVEDNPAPEQTEVTVIVDDEPEPDEAGSPRADDSAPQIGSSGGSPTRDAYEYTPWSDELAPEYFRITGYSQMPDIPEPGTAVYSSLDQLGRAGQAVACITYQMMDEGRNRQRRSLSNLSPSGWGHNDEVDIELVDGTFYHGLFWNRSHLIAKSLGGDDSLVNLVCGTRMQNVGSNRGGGTSGGMAYCENLARMWLETNRDGWIAYAATPVYEDDELVCRSVIVDMRSSDGELDLRIEVYNVAKGYEIDYATGEFSPLPSGVDQ